MGHADGHPVRLVGGRLVLDFLNTADWTAGGAVARESLVAPDDARAWMAACGLPPLALPPSAAELRGFRDALRPLFLGPVADGDGVGAIAAALAEERAAPLARGPTGQVAVSPAASLRRLLAIAAVTLLADPREAGRVKLCPGRDCGWLFLDETRGGRRRWCSMATCGNREKARRSYGRTARASAG